MTRDRFLCYTAASHFLSTANEFLNNYYLLLWQNIEFNRTTYIPLTLLIRQKKYNEFKDVERISYFQGKVVAIRKKKKKKNLVFVLFSKDIALTYHIIARPTLRCLNHRRDQKNT